MSDPLRNVLRDNEGVPYCLVCFEPPTLTGRHPEACELCGSMLDAIDREPPQSEFRFAIARRP